MDKRLSQYVKEQNGQYINYYRSFKRGELKGAYQDDTGHIFIKEEMKPVVSETVAIPSKSSDYKSPDIKVANISLAEDTNTRRNRAYSGEITNRYANIDSGIVPFYDSRIQGNVYSGITVRDTIMLINKCYHNFSIMKNIIELLTEFSSGNINLKGGNKKSRDFFNAYFKKISLSSFISMFFREYYRSGNVFTYIFEKNLLPEDVIKISTIYGNETTAAKKVILPSRFIILNPIDISVGNAVTFLRPVYYKMLNSYELERLRNPLNETDKEILQSLPPDVKDKIINTKSRTVILPLKTDDVIAVFNGKQSYEALVLPPFFPVLDDIEFKIAMRKMDMATMKLVNSAILLITTGDDKVGINYNNINALTQIFKTESTARILVHDYTTKAQWVIPDVGNILDPKKYEAVNNDIFIGLNYILLGDEKFANQASKIQIFVERINHARRVFIDEFLYPIVKRISKELNFKNYPEPYFQEINLKNEVEWARIYTQLASIGFLTPDETFNALDNGTLPLSDESLENQQEFRKFRDKGYYQPITGGDYLANKLADKKVKQTEQKISENAGRPPGTTRQQSTKTPRVLGNYQISVQKMIENVKKIDSMEKEIMVALCKKHKLKKLNEEQLVVAHDLAYLIVKNEELKDWESSVAQYIEKRKPQNQERLEQINLIAAEHGIETNIAAILFNSLKDS